MKMKKQIEGNGTIKPTKYLVNNINTAGKSMITNEPEMKQQRHYSSDKYNNFYMKLNDKINLAILIMNAMNIIIKEIIIKLFKIHNRLIICNIHNELLVINCVHSRLKDKITNTCTDLTLLKFEFIRLINVVYIKFRMYNRLLESVAIKLSHNVIQPIKNNKINNNKLDLIIAVGYVVFVLITLMNIMKMINTADKSMITNEPQMKQQQHYINDKYNKFYVKINDKIILANLIMIARNRIIKNNNKPIHNNIFCSN